MLGIKKPHGKIAGVIDSPVGKRNVKLVKSKYQRVVIIFVDSPILTKKARFIRGVAQRR